MNKTIRLMLALAMVLLATSACKSKQKVAEISGANIKATPTTSAPDAVMITPKTVTQPATTTQPTTAVEPEKVKAETFNLAEGETNIEAMRLKYHVVVGSFKSQVNASGLENTLVSEGNKALVVVNEQGMFRVLIASFNDYTEAHKKINSIKDRFPDAWVLVQK